MRTKHGKAANGRAATNGVASRELNGTSAMKIPPSFCPDGVDPFDIEPFACDRLADVGLVLVIGIDDLDLDVLGPAVEILRGHACGLDRTHAIGVLEDAGDVVEHANADDVVGNLRARRGGASQRQDA